MTNVVGQVNPSLERTPSRRRRGGRLKWWACVVLAAVLFHFFSPTKAWADQASSDSWIAWIISGVLGAIKQAFDWGFAAVLSLVDSAWAMVRPSLPTVWKNVDWSSVQEYLGVANYWLPVAETLVVIAAVYAFQLILIVYRIVKSWLENGW